jgi:hypothetical protein
VVHSSKTSALVLATLLAHSKGQLTPRSNKTESHSNSPPRHGLEYPWKGSGHRSDDGEAELGFNLLRVKIQDNTGTTYRASCSKISCADRTLSPSQNPFKLASIRFQTMGKRSFRLLCS